MGHNGPPRQPRLSQFIDALIILLLLFVTLFATTFVMQLEEEETAATAAFPQAELAELPINDAEQAQYQKMIDAGILDLAAVKQSVAANQAGVDKYDFSIAALIGTIVLLAGYLGFVYRTSFREFREVIEEKFGPRQEGVSS